MYSTWNLGAVMAPEHLVAHAHGFAPAHRLKIGLVVREYGVPSAWL